LNRDITPEDHHIADDVFGLLDVNDIKMALDLSRRQFYEKFQSRGMGSLPRGKRRQIGLDERQEQLLEAGPVEFAELII
jgi:hypothetical protein